MINENVLLLMPGDRGQSVKGSEHNFKSTLPKKPHKETFEFEDFIKKVGFYQR